MHPPLAALSTVVPTPTQHTATAAKQQLVDTLWQRTDTTKHAVQVFESQSHFHVPAKHLSPCTVLLVMEGGSNGLICLILHYSSTTTVVACVFQY